MARKKDSFEFSVYPFWTLMEDIKFSVHPNWTLIDDIEALRWELKERLDQIYVEQKRVYKMLSEAGEAFRQGDQKRAESLYARADKAVDKFRATGPATRAKQAKAQKFANTVIAAWNNRKQSGTKRAFVIKFVKDCKRSGQKISERNVFKILELYLGRSPQPWPEHEPKIPLPQRKSRSKKV